MLDFYKNAEKIVIALIITLALLNPLYSSNATAGEKKKCYDHVVMIVKPALNPDKVIDRIKGSPEGVINYYKLVTLKKLKKDNYNYVAVIIKPSSDPDKIIEWIKGPPEGIVRAYKFILKEISCKYQKKEKKKHSKWCNEYGICETPIYDTPVYDTPVIW